LKLDGTHDAREGSLGGNWRMEWVAITLHATSELGVSSITTADAHTSASISRLNWRPCRFKWTRPFRRKTTSCLCACAITFQTQSTKGDRVQKWRPTFRHEMVVKRSTENLYDHEWGPANNQRQTPNRRRLCSVV